MSLQYIVIIFLLLIAGLWATWKWAPEPPKTILLWVLSIALVGWVLYIVGFWAWLAGVRV